jgi:small subunit ribosomal protein S14
VAKKSIIERKKKRDRLVAKYSERRIKLKALIKSSKDFDTIMDAQAKLAKLPRNSSPVQNSTICLQCGRSRGVYRKFGLCRLCLRQQLMAGNVPGGRKSSW